MSWLIVLAIVVIITTAIWLILRPQQAQGKTEAMPEVANGQPSLAAKVTNPIRSLAGKVTGKREKKMPERFRTWIVDATLTDEKQLYGSMPQLAQSFTAWLAGLSDDDMATFSQEVSGFCANMNFQLDWILDQKLEEMPELKAAAEEFIVLYCLADWKARSAQDDISAYVSFEAWQENPSKKDQRLFTQHLFASLVEEKLVAEPSTELFIASEDERHTYAVKAIRQAAEEDRQAFNVALKKTVAPQSKSPALAEPETTQAQDEEDAEEVVAAPPAPRPKRKSRASAAKKEEVTTAPEAEEEE